jgi:hypothetical protein
MLNLTEQWKLYKTYQRQVPYRLAMRRSWQCIGVLPFPQLYYLSLFPQLICALASTSKVSSPSRGFQYVAHPFLATAGNVSSPRPGMWDMLGRAKWCLCALVCRLLRLTSSQGCMGKAQRPRSLRSKMVICGCSLKGLFSSQRRIAWVSKSI